MTEDHPPPPGGVPFDTSWIAGILAFTRECERALAVRRRHPGPAVTVFGSARSRPGDPSYEAAVAVGRALARRGVAVITGGGPGAMEAANRGAHEVDPRLSMGFNIRLPHEQSGNAYVLDGVTFSDFAPRKLSMVDLADGFVHCEGGWGTRDELFEVLTKTQTQRGARRPVVLLESRPGIWDPLLSDARQLADAGMISCEDLGLLQVTDDPERAAELASGPSLSGVPLESMSSAAPAWGTIHGLLRKNRLEAALLEPIGSSGWPPTVVLPTSWVRGRSSSGGGGTLGDELRRTLEAEGYRETALPVRATGVNARRYERADGDAVAVASVDWSGVSRPHAASPIERAVEQARHSIGSDNHVIGGAHRLALSAALGHGSPEELVRRPWVDASAREGAVALLAHHDIRLAAGLKNAHEHPGQAAAGPSAREGRQVEVAFETGR